MSDTPDTHPRLTLREALGAAADPDFEIEVPPGWQRRTPDDADLRSRERTLTERLTAAGRNDLFPALRQLLHDSHRVMTREGTIAYYVASDEREDTLWIPASILVTVRRAPAGGSLDELVRHAIEHYAATPLMGDRRFIRFQSEQLQRVGDGTVAVTTLTYVTPVPGSQRRRALQLVAAFGRPVDMDADDPKTKVITAMLDLCVSTLRWKKSAVPSPR